jgi:hypothetical protein
MPMSAIAAMRRYVAYASVMRQLKKRQRILKNKLDEAIILIRL